ncbi:MAG: ABC transporter substrate-binding protein [Flavobacterium sp. BFFFF2]|nr:MAG: ABC transporter substrate-binding protein [Flavobacterium sp. BFFFF2]
MTRLRIVGVPEHFNTPWYDAIKQNHFTQNGIDLQWSDVPEGTGRICQMLRDGSTDVAVLLTEGIVRDIALGNPAKIVQVYVQSPLLWGIHVAAKSNYTQIDQIKNGRAAISRFGSGSHLMTYVLAEQQGWPLDQLHFECVHTLEGAKQALPFDEADYFLWEQFMTQPVVDEGIFRRLDICPTPWPSFVIAVRNDVLQQNQEAIDTMLRVINEYTAGFKNQLNALQLLKSTFPKQHKVLAEWLTHTAWSQEKPTKEMISMVQDWLLKMALIPKKVDAQQLAIFAE